MPYIRRLIPKSLLMRFMLIITIPAIAGQLLAVYLFYDRHWYNVTYYTSQIITQEIKSLVGRYKSDQIENIEGLNEYLSLSYEFLPDSNFPIEQTRLPEELQIFKAILKTNLEEKIVINLSNKNKIIVFILLNNAIIKINFASKLLVNPTTYVFVLWIIFITVILLTISLIFSKNQIKSILELAEAADLFGRGVLHNYKPSGAKEIRKTGIAFIKMKERIEKQVAKRTQMLAMISHDLRTPLTRMKLQLEMMRESEEKEELTHDILSMEQMISLYLDFARGEGGEEFVATNISTYLQNYLKSKWSVASIDYTSKTKSKILLKLNSFERAISNIINNAVKYSSKIKISVYPIKTNICIDIEDNGKGIKDEEKKYAFKAFYRSDKSRSLDDSGHVGLGLAIAKEIILGHNGTIELNDSADLGGLMVKITLPKAT